MGISNKRACLNEMYGKDHVSNFSSVIEVDENEKFTRNDNDNPLSFFTNEYCQYCGCKY